MYSQGYVADEKEYDFHVCDSAWYIQIKIAFQPRITIRLKFKPTRKVKQYLLQLEDSSQFHLQLEKKLGYSEQRISCYNVTQ